MTSFSSWALSLLVSFAPLAAGANDPGPPRRTVIDKGIRVTFDATRVAAPDARGESFQEGDAVRFRFTLTDPAEKVPIRGANARAWLSLRPEGEIPAANAATVKAARFLTGGIFGQADLDLNSFYVLALNSDTTISVVDPLFGFGNTKLLALIPLPANGYDWVMTQDQAKLFVSIPEKKQIAAIDTSRWEVSHFIEAGLRPARLALQPDGQYLWAAGEGSSDTSVAAFRADTFAPVATLPVGRGHHSVTVTGNSAFVFVTNDEDDSVSVIDTRALAKVKEIKIGRGPGAAAYSELADALYVCATGAGEIAVLDAKTLTLTKTIRTKPGLADIAAAPGGRHLLAVNRKTDTVEVIDASSAEIIQTGTVGNAPFQITFSRDLAYINHLGSSEIFMLPLSQLGRRGQPLSVVTFPAGQQPLGEKWRDSPAARIVPVPGEGAVLVADTRDRAIYFYKEGMAAPMGTFNNYKREPMAVQLVDRSLRERGTPGVYETVAKLGKPGLYDVIFFLDSPKIVDGFELSVAPNPKLEADRNTSKVVIAPLVPTMPAKGDPTATFKFRVTDKKTSEPVTGLRDLVIVIMAPGNWHARQIAKEEGDGVYSVTVAPPQAGVYYAHAQCLSLNVEFGSPHYPVLRIAPASPVSAAAKKNE
ncbi:MAG TPA: YncE family protein [Chthoniobacterales bacterium]|nr:YncE family protein [Chthoniobacterales bacterium]